jgi:hypothetical protein
MDYVREFIEANPRIPSAMMIRSNESEDGPTEPETMPEYETDEEDAKVDNMENDYIDEVNDETDSDRSDDRGIEDEAEEVEDSDTESEECDLEGQKEDIIERLCEIRAKVMYEEAVKSRGKKFADKLKGDLINIARSKIMAELSSKKL